MIEEMDFLCADRIVLEVTWSGGVCRMLIMLSCTCKVVPARGLGHVVDNCMCQCIYLAVSSLKPFMS